MNLLHLVHQYPPEAVGGTELYTQTVAARQARAGHRVTVVYPSQTDHAQPSVTADGVSIRPIPIGARGRTAVFLATWRHAPFLNAFTRVVDTVVPDLVHIEHLMGIPATVVDVLAQRGIPYVITLHDYWFPCANAQLITNTDETICAGPDVRAHNCAACALARAGLPHPGMAAAPLALLLRHRIRRLTGVLFGAAALIAPTRFVRDVYRRTVSAELEIHVVPHGIEAPAAQLAREATTDGVHVAYIGGIARQKGVHCLIEAFNDLPPAARLSIVGDDTTFPAYAADLQRRATHPGIAFIGRIPHAALWSFLADVDLVAVPTLWYETASLIVQEAFAAEVPVIASDIGVLPERVRDGVDGVLVPPGDVAAWRAALRVLVTEPARLDDLRRQIQPVVTIDAHSAAIERVYAHAVSRENRPKSAT